MWLVYRILTEKLLILILLIVSLPPLLLLLLHLLHIPHRCRPESLPERDDVSVNRAVERRLISKQ